MENKQIKMQDSVVYIVLLCSGQWDDYHETPIFVTLDKEKAENWVCRFNRIIEENQERILGFYDDEDYSKPEPFWWNKLSDGRPMARIQETKLR